MRVALTVDADDETLEALVAAVQIDMLQLHGRESPERVAEMRARFERAGDEGVGIRARRTWALGAYAEVADQVLVERRAAARRRRGRAATASPSTGG